MRKQSIKAALKSAPIRRALNGLAGCPVGGWAQTAQARRQLGEELPRREERSYGIAELIDTALTVDHADRYQWREAV